MRLGETQSTLLPKGQCWHQTKKLRAWTSKALKPSRDGGEWPPHGESLSLYSAWISLIPTWGHCFLPSHPISLWEVSLHLFHDPLVVLGAVKYPKAISFPSWPRPASPVSPHGASEERLTPHHPGSPPLSSLQFAYVSPVLGPKTGLSIWMWC